MKLKKRKVAKTLITNSAITRFPRHNVQFFPRDSMMKMKKRNLKGYIVSSLPATISDPSGGIRYLSAEGVDENAGDRTMWGDKTTEK